MNYSDEFLKFVLFYSKMLLYEELSYYL